MNKLNLIIVGALPPPRGGVTTHVERLIPYLQEAGIDYIVLDHLRQQKGNERVVSLRREPVRALKSLLQKGPIKVSHGLVSNVSIGRLIFYAALKLTGVRITITFVGSPDAIIGKSQIKLFCCLKLAQMADHTITVNKDLRRILAKHGISESKISVIPAFIPSKEDEFNKPVPEDILDFCSNRKPLIVTYAYGPAFHAKEDLYGLDLLVMLAKKIKTQLPQTGILAVIPAITNNEYFAKLKAMITSDGLSSMFCFAIGNDLSFISFLKYADVFIRATNTDGDALTLREALYYGIPSIASDVCWRPEGTILFKNRDVAGLYEAFRKALPDIGRPQARIAPKHITNNAMSFIEIFKKTAEMGD